MLRKIESLRKQPKHIRNRYAFVVALSLTLVIVLVWGISLPSRFAKQSIATNDGTDAGSEIGGTLSDIGNYISAGLGNIEALGQIIDLNATTTEPDSEEDVPTLFETSSNFSDKSETQRQGNEILIEARQRALGTSSTSTATSQ